MSVNNRRKRTGSNPDNGITSGSVDETGYDYPIGSRIVEQVLEGRQIEARINANSQAIDQLETIFDPNLPIQLNAMENRIAANTDGLSFVQSDIQTALNELARVDEIATQSQRDVLDFGIRLADIDILATENRSSILGFVTRLANIDILTRENQNNILNFGNSLQDHEARITDNENSFTSILDSSEQGGVPLRNLVMTIAEGDARYISQLEFGNLLAGQMTPGITDLVAFSLADVEIGGVRQNLNDALAARPTANVIQTNLLFTSIGYFGLSPLTKTLPEWLGLVHLNLNDLGGIKNCFAIDPRTQTSAMKGLTIGLRDEMANLESHFERIRSTADAVQSDFGTLAREMQHFMDILGPGASMDSLIGMLQNLMGEFRQAFDGVSPKYFGMQPNFAIMRDYLEESKKALKALSDRAEGLVACGTANLGW